MALTIAQAGAAEGTSTTLNVSVTASVGDWLLVASFNESGSTASVSSVTDAAGNTYSAMFVGAVDTGDKDAVLYLGYVQTALSSQNVTVTYDASTNLNGAQVYRLTPGAGEILQWGFATAGNTDADQTTATVTTGTILNEWTVFGFTFKDSTAAVTADTDTTRGSWSSQYGSGNYVVSQYKTVNADGTQTYNTSWTGNASFAIRTATVRAVTGARVYLPHNVSSPSNAPDISPAADGGWEKTTNLSRVKASLTKTNVALGNATDTKAVNNTAYDVGRRQYVLGPLAAQTISGDVLGVIRASQSNAAADASAQMSIRVVSSTGSTVRGTALALSTSALAEEFATTLTSRFFPVGTSTAALSSVTVQDGDYLVIEIGARGREASTTSRTFTWTFGDPTGTNDLPLNQTTTTNLVPWVDFYGSALTPAISDTDNNAANVSETEALLWASTDTDNNAANVSETEAVVVLDETVTVSDADTYAANVDEAESLYIDLALSDTDDNATNVSEAEDLLINLAVDDTDSNAANASEDEAIAVEAADTDNNAANVSEDEGIAVEADDTDSLAANVTEADAIEVQGDFAPLGLRVDVYDAAGNKVSTGPVLTILASSYEMGLDRVGAFSLSVPADSEDAALLTLEREVRIYRESEGLVFRGIIARRSYSIGADGQRVLDIAGDSIARQLVKRSTLLGLSFSGAALSAVVGGNATAGSLLHGTGWSAGSLATPSTTLLARYDGLSRWEALTKAAEVFGLHVREDNLNKEVDVIAAGTASGIVLQNVEQWTPELAANRGLFPVTQVGVEEQSQDLVNRLVPLGAGEGINQLTLRYSNRTTPYTVDSATGPDGKTYYYIEDAASVASYGLNERVVSVKEAIPLANSTAGYTAAANALYDVAATALSRSASPLSSYTVTAAGLRHVDNGAALFEPGQTMRLVYRGLTTDETGTARSWLDVDEDLYLMGFSRSFDSTGADSWSLTLTTADRFDVDPAGKLADTFSAVHALQVALRYYTYHEVHILERTSIASGSTASMTVKWDGNVSLLHQAKLTFKVSALRSNVTVAASGGGTTSSSAGGQEKTSSSGGSTTSSSESSHTHTITVSSVSSAGDHRHRLAYSKTSVTVTSSNNSAGHTHDYSSSPPATTGSNSVAHTHTQDVLRYIVQANSLVGDISTAYLWMPDGGDGSATEIYTDDASSGNHTHTASATSAAGSSHSHTVSAHTHTVTIDAHTHTVAAHEHNLTYGIYTATAPTSPAIGISINGTTRTVALGGPWNTVGSEVEVDITQYLQAASSEVPLQQSNEIVFSGAVLADVSAVLRSRVTASSLLPV